MRIVHIVDKLSIGGLEQTIKDIVINLDRDKYQNEVWCLIEKGELSGKIEDSGIPVKALGMKGGLGSLGFWRLVRELRKSKFDIMHSHGLFASTSARVAAILAGVPIRFTHCQSTYYGLFLKERIKVKFLSFFTAKVIAVSEAVKKSLVEFIGINPERIEVVYNCAPALERSKDFFLRQELGIEENDFVFGNVSRLEEIKGHRYILEALAADKLKTSNCKCLIVGDGPQRKILELQAENLGIKNKVIFTGWRLDIERYLSLMDVFVLASVSREGLGICLLEAASLGLPLIGTDIGGIIEVIQDAVNGFIVPPENSSALARKIEYLRDNPQEIKRMGENSRRIWQEKFSLEEMLAKIGRIYDEAFNARVK